MTPQEKAQQLYDKFYVHAGGSWPMQRTNAQKAAIIHVDETLLLLSRMQSDKYLFDIEGVIVDAESVFEYYEEVKNHINEIE